MPPPPTPPPHLRREDFVLPELEDEPEEFIPMTVREGGDERRAEAEQFLEEAFREKEPPRKYVRKPIRTSEDEDLLEETFDKRLSMEELQQSVNHEPEKTGAAVLFDSKDIALKTDLSPREVVAASKLLFIANRYHIDGLSDFIYDLLRLKVSQYRKGRGEFIQGLHAEERRQQGMVEGGMRPIDMLLNKLSGGGGG